MARRTSSKSKWPLAWPTSKITPRSLALRTSGSSWPFSSMIEGLCGV